MKGFREVKRNSKNMNNLKENYISWREKKNDIIIQFYLFSIVFLLLLFLCIFLLVLIMITYFLKNVLYFIFF